jgi:hypothetical protein
MQYALLIYGDEKRSAAQSPEETQAEMDAYWAFGDWLKGKGWGTDAAEALHGIAQATTVRVRDGETVTTDGPFAETREQLGGFYIVDCDNLDQAIEAAARIPGALHGSVEIRPVVDFSAATPQP